MPQPISQPLDDRLEILDGKPGVCSFIAWRNMTVIVWTGQADFDAVARLKRVTRTMSNLHRIGFSNIHLAAGGFSLPTSEARSGFIELMKDYAASLACIGVVVGGTGFAASTMRSFITGMRVVSPWSFDFRVCGTIDEIGQWLPSSHMERTGVQVSPGELSAALKQAERIHAEANPA